MSKFASDTAYVFRITAQNTYEKSKPSLESNSVTPIPTTKPGKPSNLVARVAN